MHFRRTWVKPVAMQQIWKGLEIEKQMLCGDCTGSLLMLFSAARRAVPPV